MRIIAVIRFHMVVPSILHQSADQWLEKSTGVSLPPRRRLNLLPACDHGKKVTPPSNADHEKMSCSEKNKRCRADEMHNARTLIPTHQGGDSAELYRPVNGYAADDAAQTKERNACVGEFLQWIVLYLWGMFPSNPKIILDHRQQAGDVTFAEERRLPAVAGRDVGDNVDDAIDRKDPHGEEMPLPRTAEPSAKRKLSWNCEIPDWRSVVYP